VGFLKTEFEYSGVKETGFFELLRVLNWNGRGERFCAFPSSIGANRSPGLILKIIVADVMQVLIINPLFNTSSQTIGANS